MGFLLFSWVFFSLVGEWFYGTAGVHPKRWHPRIGYSAGPSMYMAVCVCGWYVYVIFIYSFFVCVCLKGEMERFVRICM